MIAGHSRQLSVQCAMCYPTGEVPEWTIGAVSKTVVVLGLPWVRIPPSPQVVDSLRLPRKVHSLHGAGVNRQ